MLAPIHIYVLIDPRTEEIRYVGKSIRPYQRLTNHMNEQSRCHRTNWLKELKAAGLKPRLEIVETLTAECNWQDIERSWIARLKEKGVPLTNNTSGGDGTCDLPPETRARMRLTWLGRKHSPETLLKLKGRNLGRKASEETREKQRLAMVGREIKWLDKISERNRKISPEQAAEIRTRIANGERVNEIAKEFKVHRTTLSKVKMGRYLNFRQDGDRDIEVAESKQYNLFDEEPD